MTRLLCLIAAVVAAILASASSAGQAAHDYVLENSYLRLVFDGARGGALTSFLDKRTQRDFISKDTPPSLYTLSVRQASGAVTNSTEQQSVSPSLRITRAGYIQSLTISASDHVNQRIGVEITCDLPDSAASVSCRIKVLNHESLPLARVRFPNITVPLRLGDSPLDDRLLLPACDGMVVENPEKNIADRQLYRQNYPGDASVQLWAFYDGSGGISAAIHDSAGYYKQINTQRFGKGLNLSLAHFPEELPRREVEIPYPVVLGIFEGDWQSAADIYKGWAEQQPWSSRPLLTRKDKPAWLTAPPFLYTFALRIQHPDGRDVYTAGLLPQFMDEYAKALGTHAWAVLTGWEKNGFWVTPDYFPPFGGNATFKGMTAGLAASGNRSGYFLSGLRWTLKKTNPTPYDSTEVFKREGERYAIVDESGSVLLSGKPDGDVGQFAILCPGTQHAQDLIVKQVLESLALGLSSVQLDQAVGGGSPPCYSKTHGHPPGGGNWSAKAMYRLFERIREEGRKRNPEFAFLIEEPGEYFNNVLDAYHGRDYAEGRWPRNGAGVRGVPLFTHIYHAYLSGNGGDSAGISAQASDLNVYTAAINLVAGKIPAVASWSGPLLRAADVHPDQMRIHKGAFRLLKTSAHDYLLFGDRLATPPLDVPDITIAIGSGAAREVRQFPGVLYSGWTLPGGKTGYVFVNLSDAPVSVNFSLRGRAPAEGLYHVRRFDEAHAGGI